MQRIVIAAALMFLPALAHALTPGRNVVQLRGQRQDVYYYPASGERHGSVLFLPGDGGWRGFAIEMAAELARAGMDVYGWDVKQYLTGFTSSRGTLSQKDIQSDTATVASSLGATPAKRFVIVGWSQGAAMAVLAAASAENQKFFSGTVVLGLPESGVLGWRFADNLTYITKAEPNEPKFSTGPWLPAISPLRFGMIHSTADEYVTADVAKRLFALAREPRRLDFITSKNHRYEGNRDEFFRILREQVKWAKG